MVVIQDKVGRQCRNLNQDVKVIQDALNRVPVAQGGTPPNKKLDVDGNCGSKTIEAIQLFQLKQFGWSGADGKIFPGGQTHIRLNQILGQQPPVTTPTTEPQVEPTTNAFLIRLSSMRDESTYITRWDDLYILIEDAANAVTATYKIPGIVPRQPKHYTLPEELYWSGDPISVNAFENALFNYVTVAVPAKTAELNLDTAATNNTMIIRLDGDTNARYFFNRNAIIWEAYDKAWRERNGVYEERIVGLMKRVS